MAGPSGKGGKGKGGKGKGGKGGKGNNNQGNNNNSKKCTHCGKTNHTSDKCFFKDKNNTNKQPQGKGKSGEPSRPCNKCKGWHLDKDCRTPDGKDPKTGLPLDCKHCHGPHYNNCCPVKLGKISATDSNGNQNTNNTSNPATNNGWNAANTILSHCPYCGADHLVDDCPHKNNVAPGQYYAGPDPSTQPPPPLHPIMDPQTGIYYYPQPPARALPPPGLAARYQDDSVSPTQSQYPFPSQHSPVPGYSHSPHDHYAVRRETDGDIVMEDVESCMDCEFDIATQTDMIRQRAWQEQLAQELRMEEMRRLQREGNLAAGLLGGDWGYGNWGR